MESITQRDRSVNRSDVPAVDDGVSAELRAANQRLYRRRLQEHSQVNSPQLATTADQDAAVDVCLQPSGWLNNLRNLTPASQPTNDQPTNDPLTIRLHPSLASAFHKHERVAEARLWLLCRAIDTDGRGWLDVATIRQTFASRDSDQHIAGWRRVRQLLQRGRGVLWERDARDRVWLYSAEKVAHRLNITQLSGRAVNLPLSALLVSLRNTKAHFYAAFHSGRNQTPISRSMLTRLTGVSERTQREYDKLSHVTRQTNIALGAVAQTETRHEHFARRAGAFEFIDKQGKQGQAGLRYQAWQLPNSYGQAHKQCGKNYQKRANRRLRRYTDLAIKRAQGNGVDKLNQQLFFTGKLPTHRSATTTSEFYYQNRCNKLWYCMAI
ncbi:MAG TPA: hypothetical protein ENJ56_04140 [Anaerolineae bacterium]|nr:hypothetical protein [Anaerolineae bacterium]